MRSAANPGRLQRLSRRLSRRFWLSLAFVLGAMVVLANVHLVYVAITSQPPCVPHLREPGQDSITYRAAQSAC